MAIFYPLCSSSKGNCTFIGNKNNGILIDAGIGPRIFSSLMAQAEIEKTAIKAIFITHDHSDHIKGLSQLVKMLKVPVYGTRPTLEALVDKRVLSYNSDMYEVDTLSYITDYDMQIEAFFTPHDSISSVGYSIITSDNKKIGFSTDLGYFTNEVYCGLSGCDFVFIESNYDDILLENGDYPYFLKQRIKSDLGHLSNNDCAEAIKMLISTSCTSFMLGHLSQQNNCPNVAFEHTKTNLSQIGIVLNNDYQLCVAPQINNGKIINV
jgi:phosphoribosyl 1,2-cyclic phosphodiesterase